MNPKRLFSLFLVLIMALSLAAPALADGDPNIDTGGGGMGSGHAGNYWNGEDGVRISVIRTNGSKVACFDWSNYNEAGSVQVSFGKHNKIDYRGGYALSPVLNDGSYNSRIPSTSLPKIVSTNGRNNIASVKRYFTDSGNLRNIAAEAGLAYDDLISGDYKLLLEPIAYFVFDGMKYAATATEAAMLDIQMSGNVYYWLRSLTHQNLPLAMFLEKADEGLGLRKWNGTTTGKQSNLDIINYLGMGLVSFKEPEPEEEKPDFDYIFHCDTDVIVSFPIYSATEITPDDNAFVTLNVGGTNYHRQFICPAGGTQLIWVRWHTPATPQELTMTASGAGNSVTLRVKVELLEENRPPDPTFYDSGSGFTLASTPDYGSNLSTTWGEWFARWIQEHGLHLGGYTEDGPWYYTCTGYCKEHGWWEFYYVSYEAHLTATFSIEPDDRCQTDYNTAQYGTVMPSGYGVQAKVSATVTRGGGVDDYDVTPIQFVVATFPEFKYETYNRLLERASGGTWQFKANPYSYYSNRVHFTPLWYPDDTNYPVAFHAIDAWTPGGQLHASGKDQLYIFQSCLDDWYIHNVR